MDIPLDGLGPRPCGPISDPASLMSRARASVLDHLARCPGPATVTELSESTGQHPNTLREHLDALVEAGFVARTTDQPTGVRGRGRPALRYAALPSEAARPQVREYAHLAGALAGHLARTSDHPQEEAAQAGRHWGRELAAQEPPPPDGDVATQVIGLLDRLGFEPETSADGVVRLRTCPLLDAARRHPDVVCHVHLGLVEGVYAHAGRSADGATIEPFAEPGACRLHLPRETARTDE